MAGDAPASRSDGGNPWWRRLAWLVALWLSGVLTMGALAYGMRLLMGWAGLHP